MRYKFKNRLKAANSIKFDQCYAKTEFDGIQTVLGMTVFQHCCAAGFAAKAIRDVFSILADKGMFPEGFPLVVSLHDTGKISPSFQKALGKALPSPLREAFLAENGLKDFPEEAEINHSVVSCAALKDVLGDVVAYIAGAHHGEFTASPSSDAQICGGHAWQEARMSLLESLKKVFGDTISQKISSLGEDNDDTEIQFILGLTVVADWISSSVSLAEFKSQGPLIFVRKVREAGFIKQVYRKGLSFTDIFGFNMRPEQLALVKSFSGPGVYILEASMGSGKTEAALYIAYLLLSSGLATGLYFALPTRFTAQQIYLRVQRFLKVIMDAENSAEAKLVFSNSFYIILFIQMIFGQGPGLTHGKD